MLGAVVRGDVVYGVVWEHWIRSQPARCGCQSRDLIGEWWIIIARLWTFGARLVIWMVVGEAAATEARRGDRGEATRWLMPLGIVPLAVSADLEVPLAGGAGRAAGNVAGA